MNTKRTYLPELLDALNKTGPNQRQKRIDMLREYSKIDIAHERVLRGFIECVFHPEVVFLLPEGIPPYKENTAPDYDFAGRSLFNFFKEKLTNYFIDKSAVARHLNPIKRQAMFIQTLESVHKDEAKLLIMMKEKSLTGMKKFMNYGLFKEAFPDWLPELPKGQ